jgi:hypothetical protein
MTRRITHFSLAVIFWGGITHFSLAVIFWGGITPWPLISKRTILTERLPLVDEI